ncbi:hypothetical protein K9L27_02465 [Candidatus Gracilibacteria bacterium]|nr:hypothetical protein [Candidatus Gracilibacteria bacterium]
MTKKSVLPFGTYKTFVKEAFIGFPKLWWRIGLVNIITLLSIVVISGLLVGIAFLIFRDTLEGIIANLQFGGKIMPQIWVLGGFALVWLLGVIVLSIVGKISIWLTLKNHSGKKSKNPFSIYFVHSWKYFGRYILTGLKIIWYIMWPIILVLSIGGIAARFVPGFPILAGFIVAGGLFLWRIVNVLLVAPTLVHFDVSSSAKAFDAGLNMVKKNWWKVFLFFVGFFALLNITRGLFLVPDFVMNYGWNMNFEIWADYTSRYPQTYQPTWILVLDGLFSFFILTPLIVTFLYSLMLHLSKAKKIKP